MPTRTLFQPLTLLLLAACSDLPELPLADAGAADQLPPANQLRAVFVDVSPERVISPGVPVGQLRPTPALREVAYLNFDGAVITKRPGASDAATNGSPLCGGTFPSFDHAPYGQDRAKVLAQVLAKVRALVSDFDLRVVTARPAKGPYNMVVLGGLPTQCGYTMGIGGLAPLDCHNAQSRDVAFIFSAGITHLDLLAVATVHELGHTFGLPHSDEGCDVMSPVYCPGGGKKFLDKQMAVWPDHKGRCGLTSTNSYQAMYNVLGPAKTSGDD